MLQLTSKPFLGYWVHFLLREKIDCQDNSFVLEENLKSRKISQRIHRPDWGVGLAPVAGEWNARISARRLSFKVLKTWQ